MKMQKKSIGQAQNIMKAVLLLTFVLASALSLYAAKAPWLEAEIPALPASTPTPKLKKDGSTNRWWSGAHQKFIQDARKKPDAQIVFVGDSILDSFDQDEFRGVKKGLAIWKEYYEPRGAVNVALAGDDTAKVLFRLKNGILEALNPKVVVFTIGHNNRDKDPKHTGYGMLKILKEMRLAWPNAKIIFLPHLPSNNSYWQSARYMKAYAFAKKTIGKDPNIIFLNINDAFMNEEGKLKDQKLIPDNVHPAEPGYRLWAEQMEPTIEKILGKRK